MIIHTKIIVNRMGINFLEENKKTQNVLGGGDKIKIILGRDIKSTKEITKELDLSPRAVRKCLSNLEKKKQINRIKGKIINKKFRYCDTWKLLEKIKILKKVPKGKIMAFYRKEHYNKSYRQHYMLFPEKILLGNNLLSALGFFDAEGTKTNPKSIEFVNSEPKLINLFIKLLKYFDISKNNLSYRIIYNKKILSYKAKENLEYESLKFWNKYANIPENKKIKLNYVGPTKGTLRKNFAENGSLNINYNKVLFRNFIFTLIEEVKNKLNNKEKILAYLKGYLAGEAYVGQHDREIQIASKDKEQLRFVKSALEKIGIRCSISKETSTSPERIIITNLKSFLILEFLDIFKFHTAKKRNLINKILNYKSISPIKRNKLKRKLKKINN